MRRLLVLLLALCLTGCGGGEATSASVASAAQPAASGSFPNALERDGFVVQPGSVQQVDLLAALSEGKLPSAYGNNAGGTYFPLILPPAPGQEVANPKVWPEGGSYKLRADEAVVFITRTPPQATYFGYVAYLGLTENWPGKDYSGVFLTGDDVVGHYHRIFGSLADTVSNRRIRTASGEAFNQPAVLVFTADASVRTRVHQALVASGYPEAMINDVTLPSTFVKMGLERGRDTFVLLGRATIWADEAAGQQYLANLNQLSQVYRVTPVSPQPLNALPLASTITRETGISEQGPGLAALRSAILNRWATAGYTYQELSTSLWIPYGFTGYKNDVDCLADNRDALYLRTDSFQLLSDDDFLVCYGVNHDRSGYSTYSDISFYGQKYLNGVAGVTSPHFPGTATAYGSDDGYYAYRLGRQVEPGSPTVVIPRSTGNPQGFAFGVDNGQDAFVVFRVYVRPPTGVAPAESEVAWDRAILFRRR